MKTTFLFLLSFTLFFSCNQWSEEDSEKYMELCEKSKFKKEECECHLENIKNQYTSFEQMSENENQMPNIWGKCWVTEEKN